MPTSSELVLMALSANVQRGFTTRISFKGLARHMKMDYPTLDKALNDLENQRFIDQYVFGGSNDFLLRLK